MTLNPGTRLSSYEITSLLGSGGMGQVYRAKDLKLGRDVAIKVLREELAADPERLRRFEQEARSASALNHPNIITIHDIGKHGETPYIAMEFVEGKTLRELLAQRPLPTKKLLQLATQIAEGLAKAHSAGIVHRDLKPENLMVSSDGYVKVLDFGLAKLLAQPGVESEAYTMTKEGTVAGAVMGTASYMSPEQALGKPLDARTDVFSLGAVLYELATGAKPFQGETPAGLFDEILHRPPPPPSHLNSELSRDFDRIIKKALEKDQPARYQCGMEMLQEIRSVTEESVTSQKRFQRSVAVLPFVNMSADPEQDYFCDGMTEEIINALTHVGNLRVIARTSAFAFKGKHEDARVIGRKLGVETLLEGSVRKAGNRVRITAQLINVDDGSHLWSDRYDRDLEDVFAIQDEISLVIARRSQVELLRDDEEALVRRATANVEAQDLYWKGLHSWNKMNDHGLKKASDYFHAAIEIDPSYSKAYVGLADTYTMIAFGFGSGRPAEFFQKAKQAAGKALRLDNNLAEAHASYGYVTFNFDWDWKTGERELRRALELTPNYANAHRWLAELLTALGEHNSSLVEMNRALKLDPLSLEITRMKGWLLYQARQYEDAIRQIKKVLELEPLFFTAHITLPWIYADAGRFEDAIESAKHAIQATHGNQITVSSLGYAYGRAGKRREALNVLDELNERSKKEHIRYTHFADVHAGLNNVDRGFEYLEKALPEREEILVWMNVLPIYDNLRSHPRFRELLRRMNFPE